MGVTTTTGIRLNGVGNGHVSAPATSGTTACWIDEIAERFPGCVESGAFSVDDGANAGRRIFSIWAVDFTPPRTPLIPVLIRRAPKDFTA